MKRFEIVFKLRQHALIKICRQGKISESLFTAQPFANVEASNTFRR